MAGLLPNPKQYYALPSGLPNVGGKVYTYAAGTSTPLATFSDAAGAVPNTNPVILDARGEALIFWNGVYKVELRDAADVLIWTVDQVLGFGNVGLLSVDTRTILAAITGQAVGSTRYLTEAGREGTFVWSSANLATKVTADTAQGIYVAPASAPTGASGAWVRKFSGEHNVKWFGATGDGTTVDYAAFVALQNYLGAISRTGFGYNVGIPSAFVPFPTVAYNFAGNAFDITYPIHWIAEGDGGGSNASVVLKWNNTSSGLRIQYVDTTGDSGTQAAATHSGSGAIFEGFHFEGGFTNGTEAERHGTHCRAKALFRNCNFFNWAGDAIRLEASTALPIKGNANLVKAENCWAENCRSGWACAGNDDTNAGHLTGFSANGCRRWGIQESSFLGNQIIGGHFDGNARTAWNTGAANHPCSYVHDSGNIYFVINGQEAGASTNRPSTTTASNTWWGWWAAGGAAPATGIPTWFNGINVRAGGPILVDGVSNQTVVVSPHIESNGVCQLDQYGMLIGNSFTTGNVVRVSGGVYYQNSMANLTSVLGGFAMAGKLNAKGDINGLSASNNFGPTSGTATDSALTLNTTNTSNSIVFNVGGVFKTVIKNVSNWFYYDTIAGGQHNFRINGVDLGQFDTNGINISSGMRLSYNGTAVLTAGVLTAAAFPALTGDVTTAGGSLATTLAAATVVAKVAGQALAPASVVATGDIRTSGGKIGYNTGAGGTQAQATSKATGVTLNKVSGEITLNAASLAADTTVSFVFTNSQIEVGDNIAFSHASVGTFGAYIFNAHGYAAGSCTIDVHNATPGALAEAIVVRFTVLKGATA